MEQLLDIRHQEQVDGEVQPTIAFEIEHEDILNILSICEKIVPKVATIPILKNIKFNLDGDTLFITAVDTEQSLLQMVKIHNMGEQKGSFLFPAKEGIELVKRLPNGKLTFVKENWTLFVNYGRRGKATLTILSAEEYPTLPQPVVDEFIQVPTDVLKKGALGKEMALIDEATPALTGICISNFDGMLGFVATDRHRVYKYVSNVEVTEEQIQTSLISARSFKQIVDSFKCERVDICLTEHYLVIRESSTIYFGRLMDANFPLDALESIMSNAEKGTLITFSRHELEDSLNRALSLDAKNNRISLEIEEATGSLVLHSQSETSEVSEYFEDAIIDGECPIMKFNGKYLKEASKMGDKNINRVLLRVRSSGSPGFLSFEADPSVTIVINPVR
ncbi:DNA polymerase III subunit beta [Paenibacillus sp. UMB7766-LJ446]|uniref:DNA polymerase III subunit beta n=1 Tax=Paenibacillus sp. UMB7766-LJ446 TaxID=3046313 RepID=UPI00254F3325|nr:DNA polymerase III subunit beta [Paenibacillus sp. UMB7766-LJ446]MDK8193143.1 DNA polymerase III subunit beta [Paenibacillus sp. UMB7766-LJ446]